MGTLRFLTVGKRANTRFICNSTGVHMKNRTKLSYALQPSTKGQTMCNWHEEQLKLYEGSLFCNHWSRMCQSVIRNSTDNHIWRTSQNCVLVQFVERLGMYDSFSRILLVFTWRTRPNCVRVHQSAGVEALLRCCCFSAICCCRVRC